VHSLSTAEESVSARAAQSVADQTLAPARMLRFLKNPLLQPLRWRNNIGKCSQRLTKLAPVTSAH
jgi:hypothetical protein